MTWKNLEAQRKWREKNKEKERLRSRQYYYKNQEKLKKYAREYGKKYKEILYKKIRENEEFRENRKIYRTCKQYKISLEEYENITKSGCMICGINYPLDIHGMNGNHQKDNLIALCPNHHDMFTRHIFTKIEELIDYFVN